jgi:membrane protein implicated in regulation of membrane protease activity
MGTYAAGMVLLTLEPDGLGLGGVLLAVLGHAARTVAGVGRLGPYLTIVSVAVVVIAAVAAVRHRARRHARPGGADRADSDLAAVGLGERDDV